MQPLTWIFPATRKVVAELPSYLLRHMVDPTRLNNLDES